MIPQPNIFSFAFVDPSMLFSTMTLKYGRNFGADPQWEAPFEDCQHIVLRGGIGPITNGDISDRPMLSEWPSARATIANIGAKISEQLAAENVQLGCVYVESLRAGGVIQWHADESAYAKAHQRFRLLVSPCAGGCWFSGGESLSPGPGNLTYFNNRIL